MAWRGPAHPRRCSPAVCRGVGSAGEDHPQALVRLVSSPPGTAYSRDTEPVTNRQTASRTRWWRFFLAAIAAAVVTLLGAGTASAATLPELETRVGASTPVTAYVVGVHECITAGQRWGNAPPQAVSVVGRGVAAKAGARTFGNFAVNDLRAAAQVADRNGLTQVGRALQKHSGRDSSAFYGTAFRPRDGYDYFLNVP